MVRVAGIDVPVLMVTLEIVRVTVQPFDAVMTPVARKTSPLKGSALAGDAAKGIKNAMSRNMVDRRFIRDSPCLSLLRRSNGPERGVDDLRRRRHDGHEGFTIGRSQPDGLMYEPADRA
jgi:hypothetical protein